MGEFVISAGQYRAVVVAHGAGLREVRHADRLLTESPPVGPDEKPPLSAGLVLAPWPNRTADGRFTFDGVEHHLDITEASRGNANHGFVRTVEWAARDVGPSSVTLEVPIGRHPGWPFDLTLAVGYALDAVQGLTVTTSVTNTGAVRAPFALGFHTFIRAGDAPADECTLTLSAASLLPVDSRRRLPAGDATPLAGTDRDFRGGRALAGVWLDDPFTDFTPVDGRFVTTLADPDGRTTELWTDTGFGWAQVFTADPEHGQGFPGRGRAVAVEPMTAPPNALASGVDLIVVDPGGRWTGEWGLRHRDPL